MNYNDTKSYKDSHSGKGYGKFYDSCYKEDTFDSRIWELEKGVIDRILKKYFPVKADKYLDFACGTGRICEYLESKVNESTGVDLAEEMVQIAEEKCKKTKFIVEDITHNNSLGSNRFDLITAFRFFLNAEDNLRKNALKEIAMMLKRDGMLIINIHGNKHSLRHIPFLIRNFFDKKALVTELSIQEVEDYLHLCDLKIVDIYGLSFMPVIFSKIFPKNIWIKMENFLGNLKIFNKFGTDLVIVIKHA